MYEGDSEGKAEDLIMLKRPISEINNKGK